MAKNKDETLTRICNQIRDSYIIPGIRTTWLKGMGKPESVIVKKSGHQGATDAIILEAEVYLKFHVKFSLPDVEKEINGYTILLDSPGYEGHLIPPLFTGTDLHKVVMLVPFQNAKTLHELIRTKSANDNWINDLYNNFLTVSGKLYSSTKKNKTCNYHEVYRDRIFKRIERLKNELKLTDIANLEIVINGDSYGKCREILQIFNDNLKKLKPTSPCTTHGDEHANNLMVYNDAVNCDLNGWVIIDYVNVKKESDWVFSIAKMLHWWQFYYVLELAKAESNVRNSFDSTHRIRNKVLELKYNINELSKSYTPYPICRTLEKEVMKFAEEMGKEFRENKDEWQKRLKLALFSIVFGSAPLHFKKANFAIPIMIHKSLEYLKNF